MQQYSWMLSLKSPSFFQVYKALLEETKSTPGAKVENNKFCLSVHFRNVDEKVKIKENFPQFNFLDFTTTFSLVYILIHFIKFSFSLYQLWDDLAEKVKSVLKEYPKLRLTQGRKVLLNTLFIYKLYFQ